jgi:hypothetical protein
MQRPKGTHVVKCDVRFGSKADMCGAKGYVRSTPKSGHFAEKPSLSFRSQYNIGIKLICDFEHRPREEHFGDMIVVGNKGTRREHKAAGNLARIIAATSTTHGGHDVRG